MSPSKPAETSYDQLTTVLKLHLVPKPIVIAERLKFQRRIQKPGENIATYLASLKQLAETCDYKAFLNEALRDHWCVVSEVKPHKSAYLQKLNWILKKHLRSHKPWKLPQSRQWSYKEQHQSTLIMSSTRTPSRGKDHATVVEANIPQMTANSRTNSARNATSEGT